MRHGIDLKTHSQCQRSAAKLPTGQCRICFRFILENSVCTAPAKNRYAVASGGAYRDRTDDPLLAKQVLSQLSEGPVNQTKMVGLRGFEPLTSPLSGVRSNQLSYRPIRASLAEWPRAANEPAQAHYAAFAA